GPALDGRELAGIVGALVEGVEDASALGVRRRDERLADLPGLGLLPRLRPERPDDHDLGHAILPSRRSGTWYGLGWWGGTRVSSRINHVSVNALKLKESVEFCCDLLVAHAI